MPATHAALDENQLTLLGSLFQRGEDHDSPFGSYLPI
jgi:hypothetical protein